MDGLMYGTIAHNLANGIGTFWNPSFSTSFMTSFHEHPPLVFGLHSLLFRLMGDGFYIERIYSLLCALVTAWLIVKLWRKAAPLELRELYALPVLFWIIVPKCFWSFQNNMLENTMGAFALASVLMIWNSLDASGLRRHLYMLLAGVMMLLGFLSKGFPALFPLALYVCYGIVFRQKFPLGRMMGHSMLLLVYTLLPAVLLFGLVPAARDNISGYLVQQVVGSLAGEKVVVERWYILTVLAQELLGMMLITAVLRWVVGRRWRTRPEKKPTDRTARFWLLVAASASLPIMVSPKQLSFYMVPSVPFFAMAFAFLAAPVVKVLLDGMSARATKIWTGFSLALLATSLTLCIIQAGTFARSESMIRDVDAIAEVVKPRATVILAKSLHEEWSLMSYFQRRHYISLNMSGESLPYMLTRSGEMAPDGYERVWLSDQFELWEEARL